MKRILIIIAALSAFYLVGCKKVDVNGDFESQGVGSYVTLLTQGKNTIDYSNLAGSKVDITVKEYGAPVDSIRVYVSKGLATTNKTVWRRVKSFAYSGDTKLEVSATEIATALGIPPTGLVPGETYTLYNEVKSKDGQLHDITNMNSSMYGNPNYNAKMTWEATVICPYTGGMTGSFRVVVDEWVDWSPGDIVQVVAGAGPNELNLNQVWPNPIYGVATGPLTVSINPATGSATVAAGQNFANYTCCGYTTNTGPGVSTGFVFSCTGDIRLRIRLTAPPYGDQGFFNLVLKKL